MPRSLNSADMITITGGIITTVGAANLDKQWGAVVVGIGRGLDTLDGHVARASGLDGDQGAHLDTTVDRFSEGIIVGALVYEDVIRPSLPVIGYGVRLISRASHKEGTVVGNSAMFLKDLAIGVGVIATSFER